jgi:hypothetical protein
MTTMPPETHQRDPHPNSPLPTTWKLAVGLIGYGLVAVLVVLLAVRGALAMGWLPTKQLVGGGAAAGGLHAGWMLAAAEGEGPRQTDPATAMGSAGGVYIGTAEGTEVRSLTAGVVLFSRSVPGFGKWVTVGNQDVTIAYMHLSGDVPAEGASIAPGQRLGNASRMGDGLGSGVMIEVSRGDVPVALGVLGLSADELTSRLFP